MNNNIKNKLVFFRKKASQVVVKLKNELLDQKSLTSPTCGNFEMFDTTPNLTWNFETNKNGHNFRVYR